METILASLIGGICVAVPSIIATLVGNSKTIYRIERLERKQDKHNSVIERTYKLEEDVINLKEDIKELRKN